VTFAIARVQPDAVTRFYAETEREALKTFYGFSVVWHEQTHDIVAFEEGAGKQILGGARIRIAASLAHVERVIVLTEARRTGIGKALLNDASDLANYYNCHKMSVLVPHRSAAQAFFEACDYREEAVLPQHTFKLDMVVLRKFLL
jgi:GNAT superfamily N-acetyltransferase